MQPILPPQATSGFLGAPKSPFVMEKTWENHRTTVKIQRKTGNIPIFHVKHIGHHHLYLYIYIHQWRLDCQSEGKYSCTQATRIWPTKKVATKKTINPPQLDISESSRRIATNLLEFAMQIGQGNTSRNESTQENNHWFVSSDLDFSQNYHGLALSNPLRNCDPFRYGHQMILKGWLYCAGSGICAV